MSDVKIPEGYKQTEVGVVPEDWETNNIGEDATLKARIGWQALTTNEYQSIGNHYLVTGTDFNAGEVQWDTCWHVDEWRYKQDSNIQLRINDVLVTKDGTIGKVGYVDKLPKPATLNSGVFVIRPKYNSFVPKYFFYVLTSSLFKEFIRNITAGSTITHLYQKDFVTFNFPVPPKKEQTAIATALSDVDNLIGSLEKLIAKKEAIKTGTMQQLLTGKTRLPKFATSEDGSTKGFKQTELGRIPEDWEVVNLGDIGNCVIGLTYSPNDVSKFGTLVLRSSNVQNGQLAYKDNVYVDMSLPERVIVKEGDILICVRNGSRRLIGKCALIDKNSEGHAFGAFMSVFRTKLYPFIFYQFQSNLIQNQIQENMGATINQITNKDLKSFTVMLPENIREQTAIATVLSDIDTEIQALQQRLAKTKDIKQGIMQQLLTGKVRLAH